MDALSAEPAEARQRWRLVVARSADAPRQTQRELADSWEASITSAGLPVAWTDGARRRPRISFGAPLPVDMAAAGELIDIVLTERWPAWRLRDALVARLPPGWTLVDVHDVWLAGPALSGRVAAADYRVTFLDSGVSAEALATASVALLAAATLPRRRQKGDGSVTYDLRPLLAGIRLVGDEPAPVLIVRTRFDPVLGTGRPDEAVAALAEAAGRDLGPVVIARERLILVDDLEPVG